MLTPIPLTSLMFLSPGTTSLPAGRKSDGSNRTRTPGTAITGWRDQPPQTMYTLCPSMLWVRVSSYDPGVDPAHGGDHW
jgi:hypothetical protein